MTIIVNNNYFDKIKARFSKQNRNLHPNKHSIQIKTKEMTDKFCPLYNDNCHVDCVHFMSAKVTEINGNYRIISPKCRLWAI